MSGDRDGQSCRAGNGPGAPGVAHAAWYIPRKDRPGGTLTSPSLLSAATFKKRKREKTERKKRQKQTNFNTGKSLLHFFKKKNGTERQAFGFCALGNPLCELMFSKPVLFQNKSLGQRKKMKRHQISLNF